MYSEPAFPRGGSLKRVKSEVESEFKQIVGIFVRLNLIKNI